MKMLKGCAVVAVIGIIAVATLSIGFGNSTGLDLWFIQGTIDRVNPLVTQVTAYASAPAPDAYFDSYADATGSGGNYVYEVRAFDKTGAEHKASLISFGGKLDGETDHCLKLLIKGSYVQRWKWVDADTVPAAAAAALG